MRDVYPCIALASTGKPVVPTCWLERVCWVWCSATAVTMHSLAPDRPGRSIDSLPKGVLFIAAAVSSRLLSVSSLIRPKTCGFPDAPPPVNFVACQGYEPLSGKHEVLYRGDIPWEVSVRQSVRTKDRRRG